MRVPVLALAAVTAATLVLASHAQEAPVPLQSPSELSASSVQAEGSSMSSSEPEQSASDPSSSSVEAPVPLPRERPKPTSEQSSEANASGLDGTSSAELSSSSASSDVKPFSSSSIDSPASSSTEAIAEPTAPARDFQVGCPAVLDGEATAKAIPSIHDGQCGLQSPLSLEAINVNGRSVPLNAPVTTDCGMATALPRWVATVDSFLAGHDNTRITKVNVGTNYMCRNVVNGTQSTNLSFHAFGDALDVVGFTLADGRTLDVTSSWAGTEEQGHSIMHFAHDAACSQFTTVLGPDANAEHHDHFHVDLGCHSKTCTARLCE
jgi:hypothetical protein